MKSKNTNVKRGDETIGVVIRVSPQVAAKFDMLLANTERGARSRKFAELIEAGLEARGIALSDARFDAQTRRAMSSVKAWDAWNAALLAEGK